MNNMIQAIKNHPDYNKVGMILCHNGVVRETSRDGRKVTGLKVKVNHELLKKIIIENKKQDGIIEILVNIFEDQYLSVGDDVMFLVVAGDIRDNVIKTLEKTLNEIKTTVTDKTEFFKQD